ncbi:hypothetical protein HanIR_Chr10g0478571 [Helianthus annuus]|nr:hypothetical protein HanIR_Chr10g0478571 [Helianthus annuus]
MSIPPFYCLSLLSSLTHICRASFLKPIDEETLTLLLSFSHFGCLSSLMKPSPSFSGEPSYFGDPPLLLRRPPPPLLLQRPPPPSSPLRLGGSEL